jgi:glycerol-3-phosphate acyltransferase PlsY
MSALAVACLAYFLGSIPSGLVLTWLLKGKDVRQYGSGNIGAANVANTAGKGIGITVGVLDALKGTISVFIAQWVGVGEGTLALVALAAVLGHDFSFLLRFRGGKGVATTVGVSLVLAPAATVAAMASWLISWLLWQYASLASLIAFAVLPIAMALTGQPVPYVILGAGLFLLGAVKHWDNIVRLIHGDEPKTGERRSSRDRNSS